MPPCQKDLHFQIQSLACVEIDRQRRKAVEVTVCECAPQVGGRDVVFPLKIVSCTAEWIA